MPSQYKAWSFSCPGGEPHREHRLSVGCAEPPSSWWVIDARHQHYSNPLNLLPTRPQNVVHLLPPHTPSGWSPCVGEQDPPIPGGGVLLEGVSASHRVLLGPYGSMPRFPGCGPAPHSALMPPLFRPYFACVGRACAQPRSSGVGTNTANGVGGRCRGAQSPPPPLWLLP